MEADLNKWKDALESLRSGSHPREGMRPTIFNNTFTWQEEEDEIVDFSCWKTSEEADMAKAILGYVGLAINLGQNNRGEWFSFGADGVESAGGDCDAAVVEVYNTTLRRETGRDIIEYIRGIIDSIVSVKELQRYAFSVKDKELCRKN